MLKYVDIVEVPIIEDGKPVMKNGKPLMKEDRVPITDLGGWKVKDEKTNKFSRTEAAFFTADPGQFFQNTSYSYKNKAIPSVKIDPQTGVLSVKAVAKTYDEFLKKRFTTDVMGYNVGTEEKKVFATIVQPTLILAPPQEIEDTLEEKIAEEKRNPETKKEVAKIKAKTKVKKLTVEQQQKLDDILEDNIAFAKQQGIPIRKLGVNQDTEGVNLMIYPEMGSTETIKKSVNLAPGLTITEERQTVAYVLSILSEIGITEEKTIKRLRKTLGDTRKNLLKRVRDLKSLLPEMQESQPRIKLLIQEFENTANKAEAILNSEERILNKALRAAREVKFVSDNFESDIEENVKEYWKTTAEEIPIDKVGTVLRRIFSRVPSGKIVVAGLPDHQSFKHLYDIIMSILATNHSLKANFTQMMSTLEEYGEAHPWLITLVNDLNRADNQTQSQFVSNFQKEAVKAKFIAILEQGTTPITEIWSSNARSIERNIQQKWRSSFKRGPIVSG